MLQEAFLLMYCDKYCAKNYLNNQALIQLTVYRNKDSYTRNNIRISEQEEVKISSSYMMFHLRNDNKYS